MIMVEDSNKFTNIDGKTKGTVIFELVKALCTKGLQSSDTIREALSLYSNMKDSGIIQELNIENGELVVPRDEIPFSTVVNYVNEFNKTMQQSIDEMEHNCAIVDTFNMKDIKEQAEKLCDERKEEKKDE